MKSPGRLLYGIIDGYTGLFNCAGTKPPITVTDCGLGRSAPPAARAITSPYGAVALTKPGYPITSVSPGPPYSRVAAVIREKVWTLYVGTAARGCTEKLISVMA